MLEVPRVGEKALQHHHHHNTHKHGRDEHENFLKVNKIEDEEDEY